MKRLLILIIFMTCNSYAAGIQKWVDEAGEVHYGDSPPAKTHTESISVSRPPSNPGRPLPRLNDTRKTDKAASDNTSTRKEAEKRTTDQTNKQVCEDARKNLDVISNSDLIRLKQTDGSERVLSDQEIDERRIQLENDVKQYCK